jgi:hypothetical protein
VHASPDDGAPAGHVFCAAHVGFVVAHFFVVGLGDPLSVQTARSRHPGRGSAPYSHSSRGTAQSAPDSGNDDGQWSAQSGSDEPHVPPALHVATFGTAQELG